MFSKNFNLKNYIGSFLDYNQPIMLDWSPQAQTVIITCIVNIFHQVWNARNISRFEGKNTHLNNCINNISSQVKIGGNHTSKMSNSSIYSFTILKKFDIQIHPRKPLKTNDTLWHPPSQGWIKCNIFGVARGTPIVCACGGIFRNDQGLHVGSFCNYLGFGTTSMAEFSAAIIALEKAMDKNWKKIWLEMDSSLVVQSFSNINLVPWRLKSRWLNIISFTNSIDFMVTHIFREGNACAYSLSNIGLNYISLSLGFVHRKIAKIYLLDKFDTPRLRLFS